MSARALRAAPLLAAVWLAAALLLAVPGAAAANGFVLRDPRLTEVSGIARGISSPGVYYVQNDSGDMARFFALDARDGRVLAEYHVPGAQNHDWEDLAVARDAAGVASVWLADIGDNQATRSEVELYRVDEPRVDQARHDVIAWTGRPDVWRLRYPTGPVDAESLAVTPHGRAFVVTKSPEGRSAAYAVPPKAGPRVQTLQPVGSVSLRPRLSLVPAALQVSATGAAISPDGRWLAIRTYTDAWLWPLHDSDLAAALRAAPTHVALPLQPQGEGICFVGGRVVVDSERVGSQVWTVALPAAASPSSPASSSASSTAASSASQSPSSSPPPSSSPSPSPSPSSHSSGLALGWRILLAAVSVTAGVTLLLVRRRGRRQG